MGADIHIAVEVRIDGKWTWIGKQLPDCIEKDKFLPVPRKRNYYLFSILADVRNYHGFQPISKPRGLPIDMDPDLLRASVEDDNVWLGDHSFSYITAKELSDYDWDQIVTLTGVVSVEEYKVFKEKGEPDGWCGGVGGPSMIMLPEHKMENMIMNHHDFEADQNRYYTEVRWDKKYSEAVGSDTYWEYSNLEEIVGYDSKIPKEDIRLVFGFDS